MKGISLLEQYHADFNVLTVVTHELSKHPEALFNFYHQHHFNYIQLIPCLPDLYKTEKDLSLTPEDYASFYMKFFDYWKKDLRQGGQISVSFFENLACLLQGMPPYQCGYNGRCTIQLVVESNGDVYPCDFYCLDEERLGNLGSSGISELLQCAKAISFLKNSNCKKKTCQSCRFIRICNGGCRRQNVCWLTDDMCAYQNVLAYILPQISSMLQRR